MELTDTHHRSTAAMRAPRLLTAQVMHKRLSPKVNSFTYRVYYLALPLRHLHQAVTTRHLCVNRFGLTSFYTRDHGARNGQPLEPWIETIIQTYGLQHCVTDVELLCMPRILGYVFNPVSFWMCYDSDGQIRAVLCEVNNTFGQTHSYLCLHPDHRPIQPEDWLQAEKCFHVSPFLPREGQYRFRFALKQNQLGIWIDYVNAAGNTQLLTSLCGKLQPLTRQSLLGAFLRHPMVTLKAVALIHWQALKLFVKGMRYIALPSQRQPTLTATLPPETSQPPKITDM